MIAFDLQRYQPQDTLYLWWLADPAAARLVGELRMVRALKGVSLAYAPQWLASGFALSEDLPLMPGEFLPAEPETAVGAVDDARPDRWGERVIRALDQPPRLADAQAMQGLVEQILSGEPVPQEQRRLIAPGTTLGGARPKALLELQGHPWVLKFNEPGEAIDMALVEHATMTLAARAGMEVAPTLPVPLRREHAVAVRRFDREEGERRRHALSARVVLLAAGEQPGYPELAQWLRRRGVTAEGRHRAQMHELFRRMVFNILIDNTDDHEKNHALLMTATGEYELSPAFDVLPSGQALGYQQMRVGAA